ncbi:MAG: PAS domain-containing sensor histidine kinase [Candidatus Obscuribacterales bacterium]|nr:PAS domain-containing sensor histidine kinase [Candidatus Obscuribacterales bacterium]
MQSTEDRQGLIAYDFELNILTVDEIGASFFDCNLDHMVGRNLEDFIPGCKSSRLFNQAGTRTSTRKEILTGQRKDGTTVPILCFVNRLNLRSEPLNFLVISLAMEEAARAELSMQIEDRFRQMSDNINEIFWITNPAGTMPIYVSRAYETIYGRSLDSLFAYPRQFFASVHPDDRKMLADLIRRQRKVDYSCDLEYRIFNSQGQLRWLWARLSPLVDVHGKRAGICGVTADITEKKVSEIRVSEFHSTISHELRTPLTSIKAALGLIDGGVVGEVSDRASHLVKIGLAETDRLIRLVSDLLDIKKIEDGQFVLEKTEFSVAQMIVQACECAATFAEQNKILLASEIDSERTIFGDYDKLLQVLLNLISNAIKFSRPNDSVMIMVNSASSTKVRFAVKDSGPGIKEEDLSKLFQKFRQLDQTDARVKGGTGLGLAISKAIVEEHGGRIGVLTAIGAGAEFWFEIPASSDGG